MVFHNVELDEDIQYGSSFGIGFSTAIQMSPQGHEQRSQRASQGRHRLSIIKQLQSTAEAYAIKSFLCGRRGSFASFPVKDWLDFTSSNDGISTPSAIDQSVGSGDGSTKDFYIFKTYEGSGPLPYSRRIVLPVSGTVVVALDGVPTTAFTVNTSTGVITFTTAPGLGVLITCGFEFRVPCRFEQTLEKLLLATTRSYDLWDLSTLSIVEDIDPAEWPDRFWPGGGTARGTITDDVLLSFNDGVLQSFTCNTSSISIFLPDPSPAPSGAPHFTISNSASSTQAITLRLVDGTSFATISAGDVVSVGFVRDTAGVVTWMIV